MKQLVALGPKQTTLQEVPAPKITAGDQVLIQNKYCGICMSEHYDWSTAKEGMKFGHEPMGVVVEVGADVKKLKVGDRVSGLFSGSGEYAVAPEADVFFIPDSITDEEAILEPLACLVSAVSKVKIPVIGDKVAVVGCGYMGCGAISLLKLRGAYVVAVDLKEASLANAKRYGADEIYTPDQLPAHYRGVLLPDSGLTWDDLGFPLVMEWGEAEGSLALAIEMTRTCGQLALGAYHTGGNRSVDVQTLNVRAIDCLSTHPREWDLNRHACANAVRMMADGRWIYKHVPTKVYPLTKFDQAHEELATKFGTYMKAVVKFDLLDGEPYIIE